MTLGFMKTITYGMSNYVSIVKKFSFFYYLKDNVVFLWIWVKGVTMKAEFLTDYQIGLISVYFSVHSEFWDRYIKLSLGISISDPRVELDQLNNLCISARFS